MATHSNGPYVDLPGRIGIVRGKAVSNARRTVRVEQPGIITPRYTSGEWGVRLGSQYYPDYATSHPTRWDGQHSGTFLTPEEADELAEHLRRSAAWARAQNGLQEYDDDAR